MDGDAFVAIVAAIALTGMASWIDLFTKGSNFSTQCCNMPLWTSRSYPKSISEIESNEYWSAVVLAFYKWRLSEPWTTVRYPALIFLLFVAAFFANSYQQYLTSLPAEDAFFKVLMVQGLVVAIAAVSSWTIVRTHIWVMVKSKELERKTQKR